MTSARTRVPSLFIHENGLTTSTGFVEIFSPSDRWGEMNRKVEQYHRRGVPLVWVVDPDERTVDVYTDRVAFRRLRVGDTLDGAPVQLCFLLVGPESAAGAHVKALSRISRLLRRDALRDALTGAASADEFLRVIRDSEAA